MQDIQGEYDINIIGDTESVDDLTDVLDEISISGKQYRHIHVELVEYLLGDQYATEHPLFDTRLDALRKCITLVRDKIRELRSTKMGSEKKNLVFSLRTEEEIFSQRLHEFLTFQMDEQPREGVAPALNVIKTLIFGVKPSRQLAEAAPRETPPAHLSQVGVSVFVGEMKWFSVVDEISFNERPDSAEIPENLTRRDCVSRVAGIFDPLGRYTPRDSGFKIDITQLTLRNLGWEDVIPNDLKQIWVSNSEIIQDNSIVRAGCSST